MCLPCITMVIKSILIENYELVKEYILMLLWKFGYDLKTTKYHRHKNMQVHIFFTKNSVKTNQSHSLLNKLRTCSKIKNRKSNWRKQ